MNRRKFFEKIGIASLGVMVAPLITKPIPKPQREGYMNIEWPTQRVFGIIVPKRRRTGSNLITNYDLTHPELIKKLYRRYGNQRLSYFQLLKSFDNG